MKTVIVALIMFNFEIEYGDFKFSGSHPVRNTNKTRKRLFSRDMSQDCCTPSVMDSRTSDEVTLSSTVPPEQDISLMNRIESITPAQARSLSAPLAPSKQAQPPSFTSSGSTPSSSLPQQLNQPSTSKDSTNIQLQEPIPLAVSVIPKLKNRRNLDRRNHPYKTTTASNYLLDRMSNQDPMNQLHQLCNDIQGRPFLPLMTLPQERIRSQREQTTNAQNLAGNDNVLQNLLETSGIIPDPTLYDQYFS